MLISEIKNKEVRERAEYYAMTMPAVNILANKAILDESFDWSETIEGHDFWSEIDDGEDLCLPHYATPMSMPPLQPGWKYTGEFRKSIKGVDHIYCNGKVVLSRGQEMEYPIVTRI